MLALTAAAPGPADRVVAGYFRARRYAGAKDRRAVSERLYGLFRRRARIDWWLRRAGDGSGHDLGGAPTPRASVIADLALADRLGAHEIAALFDGAGHAPEPLSPGETHFAETLSGRALDHGDMPAWAAMEFPAWLEAPLGALYGGGLKAEMAALNTPAAVDLRVNTLLCDRAGAIEALAGDGIEAAPTPLSPLGLRLKARAALGAAQAFRRGLVEIQDEGAQIAALLTGVTPGMTVVDFCAGAGGKTLALAALLEGSGSLTACDSDPARLKRLAPRLKRAKIRTVEARVIEPAHDPWVAAKAATADVVLVDAPCSGAGAWRRNPDAKWRLTAAALEDHVARQSQILLAASGLVAPGGRIVYVTCSMLAAENEDRVAKFMTARPEFRAVPIADVWAQTIGGGAASGAGDFLRLTPARHGTDGFFVAVLERRN